MRVIVTGGGTGGHIYPALAIADKFKEMDPETEILYVGNEEGIEKDVVPKTGYPMELVDARWLDKSSPWQLIKTGARVAKGVLEANRVMRKFKPDVVIGTGGYVCFPVIIAGKRFGARTFLHEQNAFPGLANRTLEKYVNKVFLGFSDAAKYFKDPSKMVEAGNPVRKSFFSLNKTEARKKLGFPQDDFIVFSFGGSLGAEKINEVAFELMQVVNGHEKMRMVFGTGKWYYDSIIKKAEERGIVLKDNILIKDYIDDMENYLGGKRSHHQPRGCIVCGGDYGMRQSLHPYSVSECDGQSPVLQCKSGCRQRRCNPDRGKRPHVRRVDKRGYAPKKQPGNCRENGACGKSLCTDEGTGHHI